MFGMKRVKLLLAAMAASASFPALADLAGPVWMYRLHRVGYEVLGDGSATGDEFSFWTMNERMILTIACCVAVAAVPLLSRRVRRWLANAFKLEYVVLCILVASAVGFGIYLYAPSIKAQLAIIGMPIRSESPGWKYPDEIPEKVRGILMERLNAVKADLQAAVDASGLEMEPAEAPYWQVAKPHYERESMSILTSVLASSSELRRRCKGIPIEWLRENIRFKERKDTHEIFHDGGQ